MGSACPPLALIGHVLCQPLEPRPAALSKSQEELPLYIVLYLEAKHACTWVRDGRRRRRRRRRLRLRRRHRSGGKTLASTRPNRAPGSSFSSGPSSSSPLKLPHLSQLGAASHLHAPSWRPRLGPIVSRRRATA